MYSLHIQSHDSICSQIWNQPFISGLECHRKRWSTLFLFRCGFKCGKNVKMLQRPDHCIAFHVLLYPFYSTGQLKLNLCFGWTQNLLRGGILLGNWKPSFVFFMSFVHLLPCSCRIYNVDALVVSKWFLRILHIQFIHFIINVFDHVQGLFLRFQITRYMYM